MTAIQLFLCFQLIRLPLAFVLNLLFGALGFCSACAAGAVKIKCHLEGLFSAGGSGSSGAGLCARSVAALLLAVYAYAVPLLVLYALFYLALLHKNEPLLYGACALDVLVGSLSFSARALHGKAERVYVSLHHTLSAGREAVADMVGEETALFDKQSVIRSCVCTVAEQTNEGVIIPMIAYCAGGAPLALFYRALARKKRGSSLPARVAVFPGECFSAFCMVCASLFLRISVLPNRWAFRHHPLAALGEFTRCWWRAGGFSSPLTVSVAAGSLAASLSAEDNGYRALDMGDIQHVTALMYVSGVFALLLCVAVKVLVFVYWCHIALW